MHGRPRPGAGGGLRQSTPGPPLDRSRDFRFDVRCELPCRPAVDTGAGSVVIDVWLSVAAFRVGAIVGLTGMGGGA